MAAEEAPRGEANIPTRGVLGYRPERRVCKAPRYTGAVLLQAAVVVVGGDSDPSYLRAGAGTVYKPV